MLKRLCLLGILISLGWQTCRGDGLSLTPMEIQNHNPPSADSDLNLSRPPSAEQIWKSGVGEGFICGTREFDLSLVGAFGLTSLGIGDNNHNLVMAAVHYGWIFDDVVFKDCWFRGNWEAIIEGFQGRNIIRTRNTWLASLP